MSIFPTVLRGSTLVETLVVKWIKTLVCRELLTCLILRHIPNGCSEGEEVNNGFRALVNIEMHVIKFLAYQASLEKYGCFNSSTDVI